MATVIGGLASNEHPKGGLFKEFSFRDWLRGPKGCGAFGAEQAHGLLGFLPTQRNPGSVSHGRRGLEAFGKRIASGALSLSGEFGSSLGTL